MKMHRYGKLSVIACIAVFAASIQVRADMAEASGILADIYVAATEAYNDMAGATAGSDEAQAAAEQVEAMEAIITQALAAYATLEASGGNNNDAMDALRNARQQALGEDAPQTTTSIEEFILPNIDAVPWETEGLQELHDKIDQIKQSASSAGGSDFVEYQATSI